MVDADRSAVSRLLEESRAGLRRVQPEELEAVRAAGALVVDIRPVEQRRRDGELPGAVVVDRNVLEWRLDPSSPHRLPLVDTRPWEQRSRDGAVPGAVVVDRNVLEWRLDPASPWRIPEVTGHDREVIVLCNQRYSSSLVADTLRTLGLRLAVDVVGGFEAWAAAGLPVVAAVSEDLAA